MSSRSSSPALRPLQITTDGRTLVGRSPSTKLIEVKTPSAKKERSRENARLSRKITSFFSGGEDKILEEQSNGTPTIYEESITIMVPPKRVDAGQNTELELPPSNDDKKVREKLYNTGPKLFDATTGKWRPYWQTCATEIRQLLNDALLEKMACDDEIQNLLEEKRRLEEELEEYKEYFELREYSNAVLGEDGD